MRASLQEGDLPAGARRRLEHVAKANEDQIQRLRVLLAPLGLEQASIAEATHRGLGTRLPTEQGLTNYYVNLHRDWAWGEEENQAALQELRALLGAESRGSGPHAGAGRRRRAPGLRPAWRRRCAAHRRHGFQSAAACSRRASCLRDARWSCTNFPSLRAASKITPCCGGWRRPRRRATASMLVAADALQPPFADGAFDTVVTPWFIDIIGEPFARVAARINLLLKPGGRWINFGSLAFSRAAHAERVSLEEVTRAACRSRVRRFHGARRFDAVHAFARQPACAHREHRRLGR